MKPKNYKFIDHNTTYEKEGMISHSPKMNTEEKPRKKPYEAQSYQAGLNEGKKQSEKKIEMLNKELSELKTYLRGFKDATYYCGGSK